MRVSEYFNLGKSQPYLDFLDVRLDTDVKVFVDPLAIKSISSVRSHKFQSLLQNFFSEVIKKIKDGKDFEAQQLLSSLSESNEFHLGYSKGKSRGHGFGSKSAGIVWNALSSSKAAKSGLLEDLEDNILFIEGIGPDMISDAVCNIIRGPLIEYTQNMCKNYGIPLSPDIPSGPIWNPNQKVWDEIYVDLPQTSYGKLILIPKNMVRHQFLIDAENYYKQYLIPAIQREHYNANTSLVRVLKKGERRPPFKKTLISILGNDKDVIAEETIKRKDVFDNYKEVKSNTSNPALTHDQFAEIEGVETVEWDSLITELKNIPTGKEDAYRYEDCIERILTPLFYPNLDSPVTQKKFHGGLHRVDITYINESTKGFFRFLSLHYPSMYIQVECKNYGKEIGNPEINQIASRFTDNRGRVGILVCRKIANRKKLFERCLSSMHGSKNYILCIDDGDVEKLIEDYKESPRSFEYRLLKEKFHELIDN